MGSALAARGVAIDGPAWSSRAVIEAPDAVFSLHRAYAEAGATVHTANTFRATERALAAWQAAPRGLTERAWVREAVTIARAAVPAGHLVAASLSPADDCYDPGPVTRRIRGEHRSKAEAIAASGADLVLCETFASPDEALVAVGAARATGMRVWASFTAGPDGTLLTPDALRVAAARAAEMGAERVLVNCVAGPIVDRFLSALAAAGVPFGVYANAGSPTDRLGHLVDWGEPLPTEVDMQARAQRYADLAKGWVEQGASIVGGCCGTTPTHLRVLAGRLGCHKASAPLH